jgi:flagellar hook-associated protein 2
MAVTSTSAAGGTGINVPEIVSGLMDVERVPITKLQAKIDQHTLQVTTLGVFKSKVSALEMASRAMSSPGIFSLRDASSSDAGVVVGSATSAATPGQYSVKVAQTAQSAVYGVDGFSGATQVVDLSDFSMTFGGATYGANYSQLTSTSFKAGDRLTLTLAGGGAQVFDVSENSSVDDIVSAINGAVDDGDLVGILASNVSGHLVISSTNPIQGLTASHSVPGHSTLSGVTSFLSGDVLTIDVGSEASQAYTLDSGATVAQLVTRINQAVSDGDLSGVVAVSESGELRIRALDPSQDVSISLAGSAAVSGTDVSATTGSVSLTTSGLTTSATLADLVGWVDDLEVGLDASVIQVTGSRYALHIRATESGAANSLTVSHVTARASFAGATVSTTTPPDVDSGDEDAYVLTYDGSNWAVDVAGATFDGTTLTLASGHTVTFDLEATARAGDRLTFEIDSSGTVGALSTSAQYQSQELQAGRDAYLSINGLSVTRSTNTIDDVVSGVTFDLTGDVAPTGGALTNIAAVDFSAAHVQSATVRVTAGADDLSAQAVRDFVTAYNDLLTFYKTESVSSIDPNARGVLNGDSSLRSFMDRLRGLYVHGVQLADGTSMSFTAMGVEFQRDGTLFINESSLDAAVTNGLQGKFAAGIKVGVESDALNFTTFLTKSLQVGGIIVGHISDVESEQARVQDRIDTLEEKMTRIEARLYKQYAALDALLFRLQTTSNALTSALDSLAASQNNN